MRMTYLQFFPTIIVDCDVSHAAPGGVTASVASMTRSVNDNATRYAAVVEMAPLLSDTNGLTTKSLGPRATPSFCSLLYQKRTAIALLLPAFMTISANNNAPRYAAVAETAPLLFLDTMMNRS